MRGTGKLAKLPELTNNMERSLLTGIIIEHLPESCEWLDAATWSSFVHRDLALLDSTVESFWSYNQTDGEEILNEVMRLAGAGYIEIRAPEAPKRRVFGSKAIELIRRTDRANAWRKRLSPKTREWLDFFGSLDLLFKLAGL